MSDNLDNTTSALLTSKVTMYGGSTLGAAWAWFSSLDAGFILSVLIGVAGFALNSYFSWKKDKRDEIEHQAYLKSLEGEKDAE